MKLPGLTTLILVAVFPGGLLTAADDHVLVRFETQALTTEYFSEGANAADINRDGEMDVIHGPHWYAGPDFKITRGIYPAKPQPRNRYADNFFTWPHDFNGDGWVDLLVVGLPGTPAFLYENPGGEKLDQPWPKHQVFDFVGNESPHLANLAGDERPELICTREGVLGYAEFNPEAPFDPWSGDAQLFWRGATPRARLDLEFEIPDGGEFDVAGSFTIARDYAIINVLLDDKALGEPLDLFNAPDVRKTGLLKLGRRKLESGRHKLTLETIGANEAALKKHMVGFDYLRLIPR